MYLEIKLLGLFIFFLLWTFIAVVEGRDWFEVFTFQRPHGWSDGLGVPVFCLFIFVVIVLCNASYSTASGCYPSYEESYPIKAATSHTSKAVSKSHKIAAHFKKPKVKHAVATGHN